ncbi:hypothetical protein [Litchfieldia salsa]|uniref:Uncharacterized protein n=1 Tax=Litchfieldia salsa TaxID=930152 RepID=A0A1H0VNX1_9BACI|nr:hypothetical protein [Litchfieldia salsa]SDP80217.1 hypothetical protein SAMN05216565_107116 [Litchfieldia salsa]
MGYLSQVKSNGKQYIYLTEYIGNQKYSTKKEHHVYAFGEVRMALIRMRRWRRKFSSEFPEELKSLGYNADDLKVWIETIQTGKTSNGRKFGVTIKKRAVF